MSKRWNLFLVIAVITVGLDLGSKYWARHSLPTQPAACAVPDDFKVGRCTGVPTAVIDGFWEWRLAFNKGAAFSMFHSADGGRWLLTGIGLLAVLAMLWMVHKARPEQRLLIASLAMVAGGAIGNLADRVYFGVVTDFVLWRYKHHEWPVFNIADVALVIGVGLLVIDAWREAKATRVAAA